MRAPIDMCVLDTLANDIESLEDILRAINHAQIGWRVFNHGEPFVRADIVPAVLRGVRDGLIEVFSLDAAGKGLSRVAERTVPSSSIEDCWFGLTASGRLLHRNWEPYPSATDRIYVALLGEGTVVWRPARATPLEECVFRIDDATVPNDEVWEFGPGSAVRCEHRLISGSLQLVAVERIMADI